ncbi:unnamed protein product [Owenia fusiformis]|uniref:Uncharacterized protein n=1 Tax=Owenia fusiformis TaxID=6347 RepID=A0A8J1TW27_OWEFU|nr:unnamed protein product [Owenia fusiformis]
MMLHQMLIAFIMVLFWERVMAEMGDKNLNSTAMAPTSTELSIIKLGPEPCTRTIEEEPYRCPAIGYGPSYCSKDCRLACKDPLIAHVPNDNITVSSSYNNKAMPKYSRLYTGRTDLHFGCWMRGDTRYNWIQVNFGSVKRILSVATQGCKDEREWVTRYRIKHRRPEDRIFSTFSISKTVNVFEGNYDRDTIVVNKLINELNPQGLLAQYVRLLPWAYYRGIGLRWELYSSICDPEQVKCHDPEKSFLCPDQTCQKNRWRCGGAYCSVSKFWCAATESCVPDYMICNGKSDCPNGKDESNCPVKPTVWHGDVSSENDGPKIWPIGLGVFAVVLVVVIALIRRSHFKRQAMRNSSREYSTISNSDNRTHNSAANNAIPLQASAPQIRDDGNQQTNKPQRRTGGINPDYTPVNDDIAPVTIDNPPVYTDITSQQPPPPSYDEVIASPTQYQIT